MEKSYTIYHGFLKSFRYFGLNGFQTVINCLVTSRRFNNLNMAKRSSIRVQITRFSYIFLWSRVHTKRLLLQRYYGVWRVLLILFGRELSVSCCCCYNEDIIGKHLIVLQYTFLRAVRTPVFMKMLQAIKCGSYVTATLRVGERLAWTRLKT